MNPFYGDRLMTFGLMTFVASLILGSTYLFTNFAMVLFELVVLRSFLGMHPCFLSVAQVSPLTGRADDATGPNEHG